MIFGILLVSVITALLALFLEAAHSYIANYGQVRITVNNQIDYDHIERKTTIFFGTRTPEELFYYDELRLFENRLKQFTFVPTTLSRAQSRDDWKGKRGRVTKLIETYIHDNAAVDVHICGSQPMVESCVDLLIKKGIPADRIIFDKFK